jgi:diacylglycerol kinase
MPQDITLILSYIVFMWLVILHTFEEISCDIMEAQIGHIKLTRNKYLLVASLISTVNLTTLALIILALPVGYYLGLFTSAIIGVFQAIVHTYGYLRGNRSTSGLGAGFYSSIPLAIVGIIVFVQLLKFI